MKTPWFTVRLLLLALGFGLSVYSTFTVGAVDELEHISTNEWFAMTLGFLVLPSVALLFVIGLQAFNPFSAKVWTVPRHSSNPFRLREPLLFFHFAAYFMFAEGLGYLLSGLWAGQHVARYGLAACAAGLGVLIGVRLCRLVFKHKFRQSE